MAKLGRNDPCRCGSGKKYKHCCLSRDEAAPTRGSLTSPPGVQHARPFLTNRRRRAPLPPDVAAWPIVRAYIPSGNVWRVTAMGTAGIVRQQPDGRCASAMFVLNLLERGIGMMFGQRDEPLATLERSLPKLHDHLPPFQEGPPELAAMCIWGAWALGEEEGAGFPPHEEESYLPLVPRPPGTRRDWLHRFAGPRGLVPDALLAIVQALPAQELLGEQQESAVATRAVFRVPSARETVARLLASAPDAKGFRFIPDEPPRHHGTFNLAWARPLPSGPRSIMPVRGDLQIQGAIELTGDALIASTLSLSMAARLVSNLESLLGDALRLVDADWTVPGMPAAKPWWGPPALRGAG